jgi:hypothetical protein
MLFSGLLIVVYAAIGLLIVSALAFILLFSIKAFQDPHFCRSERHVERIARIEMELMGSEARQIGAEVVEAEVTLEAAPDKPSLADASKE